MSSSAGRKALLIHLTAYVAVNAVLLALNATQTVPEGETREWWAQWPLMGWGIGLSAHAFAVWAQSRSREGQLLADPDIRGVAVHTFIYLAVNAFLITINLTRTPENLWSVWPVIGWGLGLAFHAWLAYRAVVRKTLERYATEQRILTEMQLERQAAEIASEIAQPKKKAPATRKRRRQAAAKTTKRATARRGTTKKAAPKKKAAAKPSGTTRRKTTARGKSGRTSKPSRPSKSRT